MKNFAFTLAEVLITIGIIGIAAAMTLPGVITSYQKQETVSRLKKVYATVGNAFAKAAAEYGDLDGWDLSNPEKILKEYLGPNFASPKFFGTNCRYGGCFCRFQEDGSAGETGLPGGQYTWPGGQGITSPMHVGVPSVLFMDGSCINISKVYDTVEVWIDINGAERKPNKVAKDVFAFSVNNKGQMASYGGYGCDDDLDWRVFATGTGCGSRIVEDGWQIKYDWHF